MKKLKKKEIGMNNGKFISKFKCGLSFLIEVPTDMIYYHLTR